MKKNNILITFGAVLLTGSLLSSCNGNKNSNEGESNDSVKNEFFSASNDSIASSQESDDTEMQGVFTSEETLNISELPKTAQLQAQKGNYELYVNVEQEANEDDITGVYSVWLADRGKNVVRRILITNPMAAPVWEEMNEKKGGVEVPMDQIAAAARVIYSKIENEDKDYMAQVSSEIRKINKTAAISDTPYKMHEDAWWDEILSDTYDETEPANDGEKKSSLR